MEENNDNKDLNVELSLQSGEWLVTQADELIKQYKACKTAHAQNRLRPRLDYMMKKLAFEGREVAKLLGEDKGYDEYGNEIE